MQNLLCCVAFSAFSCHFPSSIRAYHFSVFPLSPKGTFPDHGRPSCLPGGAFLSDGACPPVRPRPSQAVPTPTAISLLVVVSTLILPRFLRGTFTHIRIIRDGRTAGRTDVECRHSFLPSFAPLLPSLPPSTTIFHKIGLLRTAPNQRSSRRCR